MYTDSVKLLSTQQTSQFDTEYVNQALFEKIAPHFIRQQKDRGFNLLDVGGGNGTYSDRVINHNTGTQVTLLEPDSYLLSRNKAHPRKNIVSGTYQERYFSPKFDAIQFNWVLHHFITGNYQQTTALQAASLRKAYTELKPGGRIIILENFYDGFLTNDLPSRIIFELTSMTSIKRFIKKAGANTAGVGVCFHSRKQWLDMVRAAGFRVICDEECYDYSELSWLKRVLLTIGRQYVGLIVAEKEV